MTMKEKLKIHAEIERENRRRMIEWKRQQEQQQRKTA